VATKAQVLALVTQLERKIDSYAANTATHAPINGNYLVEVDSAPALTSALQNEEVRGYISQLTAAAADTESILLGKLDSIMKTMEANNSAADERFARLEEQCHTMLQVQDSLVHLFGRAEFA
jgi:hypothetical protein